MFKILRQCILLTSKFIALFAKFFLVSANILCWRIIGNINISLIVQICKICNLISIAVVVIPNFFKIMLRKNVVFINRILFSACS